MNSNSMFPAYDDLQKTYQITTHPNMNGLAAPSQSTPLYNPSSGIPYREIGELETFDTATPRFSGQEQFPQFFGESEEIYSNFNEPIHFLPVQQSFDNWSPISPNSTPNYPMQDSSVTLNSGALSDVSRLYYDTAPRNHIDGLHNGTEFNFSTSSMPIPDYLMQYDHESNANSISPVSEFYIPLATEYDTMIPISADSLKDFQQVKFEASASWQNSQAEDAGIDFKNTAGKAMPCKDPEDCDSTLTKDKIHRKKFTDLLVELFLVLHPEKKGKFNSFPKNPANPKYTKSETVRFAIDKINSLERENRRLKRENEVLRNMAPSTMHIIPVEGPMQPIHGELSSTNVPQPIIRPRRPHSKDKPGAFQVLFMMKSNNQ